MDRTYYLAIDIGASSGRHILGHLEDGKMVLHMQTELMDEIIVEAVQHISKRGMEHKIVIEDGEELILAKMDGRLIVQVLINLIDNAIKYTPKGTEIRIHTKKEKDWIYVEVIDTGDGISDIEKIRVFEMFYTGSNVIADGRRSIGLGLFLCKSIIEAHGGTLLLYDNIPHGCVFQFTLPAGEVNLHE